MTSVDAFLIQLVSSVKEGYGSEGSASIDKPSSASLSYGRSPSSCSRCAEFDQLLKEKDEKLDRSRQTCEILEMKVTLGTTTKSQILTRNQVEKLEQLLSLKNGKIDSLTAHLQDLQPPSTGYNSDDSLS